jgi:hypothetical protein
MEDFIRYAIYVHAALGGVALLGGLISILAKKGGGAHRKSGLVFTWSMILTGSIAMIVALLPNHENPFLFAIGIFSLYFVITGYRALRFARKVDSLLWDKVIAVVMIISSFGMILGPILMYSVINIVLVVFAIVGAAFAIRDLILFRDSERLKKNWLKLHLGKMFGAYISATTAFIVANQIIPGIYGWLLPGVLGAIVITYFMRRLKNGKM